MKGIKGALVVPVAICLLVLYLVATLKLVDVIMPRRKKY